MSEGAGKGDSPRPVNKQKYDENYERIFGKHTTGECQCALCQRHRHVEAVIDSRDVDSLISTLREEHNTVLHVGADLDYANAVLDGSWPSSVEQLEHHLAHAKKIRESNND